MIGTVWPSAFSSDLSEARESWPSDEPKAKARPKDTTKPFNIPHIVTYTDETGRTHAITLIRNEDVATDRPTDREVAIKMRDMLLGGFPPITDNDPKDIEDTTVRQLRLAGFTNFKVESAERDDMGSAEAIENLVQQDMDNGRAAEVLIRQDQMNMGRAAHAGRRCRVARAGEEVIMRRRRRRCHDRATPSAEPT